MNGVVSQDATQQTAQVFWPKVVGMVEAELFDLYDLEGWCVGPYLSGGASKIGEAARWGTQQIREPYPITTVSWSSKNLCAYRQ